MHSTTEIYGDSAFNYWLRKRAPDTMPPSRSASFVWSHWVPVVPICRLPRFLIFGNLLDSTPKSDVSSLTSRLGRRGVSRSSRNAGWDAVDAAALGVPWDRGADCSP